MSGRPSRYRAAALPGLLVILLAGSACAPGVLGSDDEVATDGTAGSVPGATQTSAVPSTAVASPQAAALRSAVTGPEMPAGVSSYVSATSDQRLDELGQLVCNQARPDQSPSDFAATAIVTRDQLTAEEQAQLDLAEFGAAFRVVAETYCPEKVPAGLDAVEEAAPDETIPPASGTTPPPDQPASAADLAAYRTAIASFFDPTHPGLALANGASDERLNELRASACTNSSPDMSQMDLGFLVLESFQSDLTAEEQALFDSLTAPEQYGELYGSLIGYFCPGRLPTAIG